MKIFFNVVLAILVFLAISSGITKITLMQQDVYRCQACITALFGLLMPLCMPDPEVVVKCKLRPLNTLIYTVSSL